MTSRVAVITGGASGIGFAVAEHLVRAGHRIGLLDLDGERASKAADELRVGGAEVVSVEVDVTDRVAVASAVDLVRTAFGPIGIVVTSAGIDESAAVTDITEESWARVLDVNLTGTFYAIQPVVADMKAAGWGRIVTISSQAAQSGAPMMAHYAASKGGVISLTKSLAYELSGDGITANTIPPSIIDTPMAQEGVRAGVIPDLDVLATMTLVRRIGTPNDVAAACAFLCSDDAGFITGQLIGVNGGMYM
jgi:2-hydroxycyclohexanecarboxyl-CoA dehydrogenase